MRKICVVTGTRAEYGLLKPLLSKIKADDELQLQLVVTGMHLSPEFGLTYREIEEDGFIIDEKVEMLLSSDTSMGVAKAMGLATISFADSFNRLKPDVVVILGDRFEMLAVAQTALVMQIPIAHIAGGECTFGAYDDAIRHSITKMAKWHFVTNEEYRRRVIQMGEPPHSVYNVGAPGIENIMQIDLLSKKQLYQKLKLDNNAPILLITLHPETNNDVNIIDNLLTALKGYSMFHLIFTKSNADNGGHLINYKIEDFVKKNNNARLFDSLGQLLYLSTVKQAAVVIGNSSSGLVEVPYLKTPTLNIGNRQKGRLRSASIIDCEFSVEAINNGIDKCLNFSGVYAKDYGDGNTSEKILTVLKTINLSKENKEFYNL